MQWYRIKPDKPISVRIKGGLFLDSPPLVSIDYWYFNDDDIDISPKKTGLHYIIHLNVDTTGYDQMAIEERFVEEVLELP